MAKRSDIAADMIRAIGFEPTQVLIKGFGGKQIRIPGGSGREGALGAWLDENLGSAAATALKAHFGGERLTVPRGYAEALNARNRSIVADYDAGMNILDLIKKYSLTERQLRTILNQPLADEAPRLAPVDDKQLGLF